MGGAGRSCMAGARLYVMEADDWRERQPKMTEQTTATAAETARTTPFWLRELPYLAILALSAAGAAYFSITQRPIVHYWDALAVFIAAVSIATGWPQAKDAGQRWRLVWTQLLHWAAFLVAMNMVFLPSVQSMLNTDSTSLFVLFQLALGTFVAGVHTASAKLCVNGAVMALIIPAVAWLDRSALTLTLIALVIIAAAVIILWRRVSRPAEG